MSTIGSVEAVEAVESVEGPSRKNRSRVIAAVLATFTLLFGGFALSGGGLTGAWFTDSIEVEGTVNTGSLELVGSDANGGAATLMFGTLNPGQFVEKTLKVKNNGTVAADVVVTEAVINADGLSNAEVAAHLSATVNGAAITGLPINLGTVAAGQAGEYVVKLTLAGTAGNAWQTKTLSATVKIEGTQDH